MLYNLAHLQLSFIDFFLKFSHCLLIFIPAAKELNYLCRLAVFSKVRQFKNFDILYFSDAFIHILIQQDFKHLTGITGILGREFGNLVLEIGGLGFGHIALEGDGVKALSAQMTPERQMSEVLLSLYNADIAQGGVDLGNGFRVASVAANKGIEDFTVNVDESKVDFKALQDSIGTLLSKKDVGGLLCMVNDFAGIVVPAISEMNYDLQVRYETPAGKRTFFKIDNADIKSFLNPVKEEEK